VPGQNRLKVFFSIKLINNEVMYFRFGGCRRQGQKTLASNLGFGSFRHQVSYNAVDICFAWLIFGKLFYYFRIARFCGGWIFSSTLLQHTLKKTVFGVVGNQSKSCVNIGQCLLISLVLNVLTRLRCEGRGSSWFVQ